MKKFTDFLTEARETSASTEAKRLGLTGDGHGGWYDKNGEFVAKTVNGELKFFGKNDVPGGKDSPSLETPTGKAQAAAEVPQVNTHANKQQTQTKQELPPEEQQAEEEVPEERPVPEMPGVVVVFGRFNPPTTGHQKLLGRQEVEVGRI